ncbi:MAG: LPS export ABC transporter ATP-binding protein [Deltaproteobacteria bacterium]|jgi:lipopolysaccharide export system ATP-binding protein|nr:LPS export ABC transporter ATP-binding protein [Deltaproteobacteria bacterium]
MSEIATENLSKYYGKHAVVIDVSIRTGTGEIVGLLGPNGAGKTTTFYMITGLRKPSSGRILLDGTDIAGWQLHERARVGLSYLPQENSVFRSLSVLDNLMIILEYTDLPRARCRERAMELLREFHIDHLAKSTASFLSGGERRRLELARSLIRNPKFILLDEPFAGIDPVAVDDIQSLVLDLKKKGIGVFISDHNVRETLLICDRAYLMHQGRVIIEGSPEKIVADPKARSVYLGRDFYL